MMQLPSDYSNATYFGGPSYSEEFFVTLVHEFGHTMGLQHTLASSVMSTLTTSASSKANPLGNDDIAGISLLYPASNYLSTVGSIFGTVRMNGTGLNLASVVAISPSNQAVSALTNPDGTYQMNGIPPGEYYIYVHPLPPPTEGESSPDNVYLPRNATGTSLQPDQGFATQFYPGTLDYAQASLIKITPGRAYPAPIDFNVNPASSPGVASVRTYSYVQSTYVNAAPILDGQTTTIAAGGSKSIGLLQADNSLTPGLSVGMLGSAAEINNLRAYPPPNPYIAVDAMPAFSASGQKHLLFSTPGNLYVLPAGFTVVDAPAPVISALAPAADGNGNPACDRRRSISRPAHAIFFDGLPAVIQSQTKQYPDRDTAFRRPSATRRRLQRLIPTGRARCS